MPTRGYIHGYLLGYIQKKAVHVPTVVGSVAGGTLGMMGGLKLADLLKINRPLAIAVGLMAGLGGMGLGGKLGQKIR